MSEATMLVTDAVWTEFDTSLLEYTISLGAKLIFAVHNMWSVRQEDIPTLVENFKNFVRTFWDPITPTVPPNNVPTLEYSTKTDEKPAKIYHILFFDHETREGVLHNRKMTLYIRDIMTNHCQLQKHADSIFDDLCPNFELDDDDDLTIGGEKTGGYIGLRNRASNPTTNTTSSQPTTNISIITNTITTTSTSPATSTQPNHNYNTTSSPDNDSSLRQQRQQLRQQLSFSNPR